MPDIVKHLRTKQVAVIGTSIVLAIAAVTFWNWSSKSTGIYLKGVREYDYVYHSK
jgi:hypothetical protein